MVLIRQCFPPIEKRKYQLPKDVFTFDNRNHLDVKQLTRELLSVCVYIAAVVFKHSNPEMI